MRCRPSRLITKKYTVKFKYWISYFPISFSKDFPLTWETPWNRKPWSWVSQEKARPPQRCCQFSADGGDVQLLQKNNNASFSIISLQRIQNLRFCGLGQPVQQEVSKRKTLRQKYHCPLMPSYGHQIAQMKVDYVWTWSNKFTGHSAQWPIENV